MDTQSRMHACGRSAAGLSPSAFDCAFGVATTHASTSGDVDRKIDGKAHRMRVKRSSGLVAGSNQVRATGRQALMDRRRWTERREDAQGLRMQCIQGRPLPGYKPPRWIQQAYSAMHSKCAGRSRVSRRNWDCCTQRQAPSTTTESVAAANLIAELEKASIASAMRMP